MGSNFEWVLTLVSKNRWVLTIRPSVYISRINILRPNVVKIIGEATQLAQNSFHFKIVFVGCLIGISYIYIHIYVMYIYIYVLIYHRNSLVASRVTYPKEFNPLRRTFEVPIPYIRIPHLIPFQSDTPEFSRYKYISRPVDTVSLEMYTNI